MFVEEKRWSISMRSFIPLLMFITASCANSHEIGKEEALAIADNYARSMGHSPNVEMPYHSPVATDHGTHWTVEYQLQAGWMGGAPRLDIDKRSGRVIRDRGEQ